ncbi:MAG: hypothetical protein ACYDDO_09200 [Acidiferrobacterales bacterium]
MTSLILASCFGNQDIGRNSTHGMVDARAWAARLTRDSDGLGERLRLCRKFSHLFTV